MLRSQPTLRPAASPLGSAAALHHADGYASSAQTQNQRRTARGHKRQWHTHHRKQSHHNADVHECLADDPHGNAGQYQSDVPVLRLQSHHEHAPSKHQEQQNDRERRLQSPFLTDDGENEIVVRFRQISPFFSRNCRCPLQANLRRPWRICHAPPDSRPPACRMRSRRGMWP